MSELNIYQRMSAVTNELRRVAKNLNVGVGQSAYKAVGEADVLDAVKPLEEKYGIYSYPISRRIVNNEILENEALDFKTKEKIIKKQFFMRVETVYRFVNMDKPEEYIETTTYGDGMDSQDKAMPNATRIPTPFGDKKLGDLKVGDKVFGVNGKPVTIIQIPFKGEECVYRLTFSDGSTLDCSKNHLWRVQNAKNKESSPFICTTENLKSGYQIPISAPLHFEEPRGYRSPCSPYILGLYIADGYSDKSACKITKKETSIVSYLSKMRKDFQISNIYQDEKTDIYSFQFNVDSKIQSFLRDMNLHSVRSNEKFIPEECQCWSIKNRRLLLQGLMDGDGSIKDGQVLYCTTSKQLAKDVVKLMTGLGGCGSIHTQNMKGQEIYYVSIWMSTNPFKKSEYAEKWKPTKRFCRGISQVYKTDIIEPMTCITVDSIDGLFIAGDNNIVTHNSPGKAMTYADKYALLKGYKIVTGDDPDQNASEDITRNKYQPKKVDKVTPTEQDDEAIKAKPIDDMKIKALESELDRTGATKPGLLKTYKVAEIKDLNLQQWQDAMKKLEKVKDKPKTDLGL